MVFKVYKNIEDKLSNFKYFSSCLISSITIKYCMRKINAYKKGISKKIIDFIKYK